MPEQITISEFISETWEDYNSPTTSNFVTKIGQCRNAVQSLEEAIDTDRTGLNRMKKSVKALCNTGNTHVANESCLAENLQKLGSGLENEKQVAEAFAKFAVVTKELSGLMHNLMQNLTNILMFPLDNLLKGDLKGMKGDLKKPFDKAWKEYEAKFSKIEKEKKQAAKDAGMIKTEVTGPEVAEDMEKERRMFQLQMCEYLLKVNEIKTKRGTDLLQHLVKYYHAQLNYFSDGLKTIEHFRAYIEDLVLVVGGVKHQQDSERKQLTELRDALRSTLAKYRESTSLSSGSVTPAGTSGGGSYSLHQLAGNKAHGCQRTGHLLKKSDGKMRKVWQRRKCTIKDGTLAISHSDMSKEPVRLNLLTCQVKLLQDDPGKKCFDLISSSKNRTYHFQADDTADMETWISVLNNAKEEVLMKAFGDPDKDSGGHISQSVKELTKTVIGEVKRLDGNQFCCDCNAPDPEWLSVNLGVLICLECCGVHRDMGVHISRTQSIVIDALATSQLLQACVMGNQAFNEVMEASMDKSIKPTPTSSMDEKKSFIRSKYEAKRFVLMTCSDSAERRQNLIQAVLSNDIHQLLEAWAEGADLMDTLPDTGNKTALHLAVEQDDERRLYIVDFMVQNSNSQTLARRDDAGNTCVHVCAERNRHECLKLLLRVLPESARPQNAAGHTPLDLARAHNNHLCAELIEHALAGRTEAFYNVNVEWGLFKDDHSFEDIDFSDDDIVDRCETPDKLRSRGSRPSSLVMGSDMSLASSTTSRADSHKSTTLPPGLRNAQGGGLPVPNTNLSGSSQNLASRRAHKAPAPPPPTYLERTNRKISDPGFKDHRRTPSDPQPPPLPAKTGTARATLPDMHFQRRKSYAGSGGVPVLSGSRLVLPPPPEFRSTDNLSTQQLPSNRSSRPEVAPKPYTARSQSSQGNNNGDYVSLDPSVAAALGSRSGEVYKHARKTSAPLQHSTMHRDGDATASPPRPAHLPSKLMTMPTHRSDAIAAQQQQRSDVTRHVGINGNPGGSGGGDSSSSLCGSQGSLGSLGELNANSTTSGSVAGGNSTVGAQPLNSTPGAALRHGVRCRALYDCNADNDDELSFHEGEIIVVLREEEEEWWEGSIEGQPQRRGMFPTTFVQVI